MFYSHNISYCSLWGETIRKLTNNKNDWDCGIQALENVKRLAHTKKKIKPSSAGIYKDKGVKKPGKFRKALMSIKKVRLVKVKREAKPEEIKIFLNEDKPQGKTQNVVIVHSKIKSDKDEHYWTTYKVNKGGKSIMAANFDDDKPVKKISLARLKKKDFKIKRVYETKIEK